MHKHLTPVLPHGGLEQAWGGDGKGAPRKENGGHLGAQGSLRVGSACDQPQGLQMRRLEGSRGEVSAGQWKQRKCEPTGEEGRRPEPLSWEGKGSNTGASREYLVSGRGQWRRCQHAWREGRDFEHPERGRKET